MAFPHIHWFCFLSGVVFSVRTRIEIASVDTKTVGKRYFLGQELWHSALIQMT